MLSSYYISLISSMIVNSFFRRELQSPAAFFLENFGFQDVRKDAIGSCDLKPGHSQITRTRLISQCAGPKFQPSSERFSSKIAGAVSLISAHFKTQLAHKWFTTATSIADIQKPEMSGRENRHAMP